MKIFKTLPAILACFSFLYLTLPVFARQSSTGAVQPQSSAAEASASSAFSTYLPLVSTSDNYGQVPAIWAHAAGVPASEVVFFRHTFVTLSGFDQVNLEIFADTRYDFWLDGKWLGRGPARFLKYWREYDQYNAGFLPAGEHLIAVRVQWAPNTRRSESVLPHLQTRVMGVTGGSTQIITTTGANWLCQVANAWNNSSAPIAPDDLIGPSELLDLRLLPTNWHLPGQASGSWLPAVVVNPNPADVQSSYMPRQVVLDSLAAEPSFLVRSLAARSASSDLPIHYQPRSIPAPVDMPVPLTLLDSGLLSPGMRIGEILPNVPVPYTLNFFVTQDTSFTMEILSTAVPAVDFIQLGGTSLLWTRLGSSRPDVYASTQPIATGWHQLQFNQIPAWGMTFAVSTTSTNFPVFPFSQANHAGKRTLLADPVPAPGAVITTQTAQGLQIDFVSTPAYAVVDLGRTVHGRLVGDISGGSGAVVDIGWDERLHNDTKPLPYPGSVFPDWNQVDSWVLDGSNRSLSTLDARAGRYILIAAWGEGPITLSNLRVLEETSLVSQNGSFTSSDPRLNQIWQVGVDSLAPNLTDAYTDTPWRERGQWWGDVYVEDHVLRLVDNNPDLMRRGLRVMANAMLIDPSPGLTPGNNGLHMLDYSMLWVQNLAEFVQSTGEVELASELYPTLQRFMKHLAGYESAQSGLLDLAKSHWTQTAYIDSRCEDCRYGQSTALNSLYYSTLLQASNLANILGDSTGAAAWQAKAQAVKTSINEILYLPDKGRYVTTLYNGELIPLKPHAQAWPLAYGITPQSEIPRVTEALMELLSADPTQPNLETYGMFWVLEALGKNGSIDLGLEVIERYYGYLLDTGATTWYERFDAAHVRTASLSHGWGGAPTWFLTNYLLGLQRTGPDSYRLSPAFESASSAAGVLPLRDGLVQVSWQATVCGGYQMDIQTNDKITGQVLLPLPQKGATLTLSGQTIWPNNTGSAHAIVEQSNMILLNLNGGSQQLILATACP